MNFEPKKIRFLIWIGGTVIFFSIIALVWLFSGSFVRFTILPRDAILTIDNAPIALKTSGKITKRLKPGKHTVRIEKDGYISFNQEAKLGPGGIRNYKVNLSQTPRAMSSGGLLAKGNELSDSYYLGDNGRTIYKAIMGFDENGEIKNIENKEITPPKLSGIQEIIWESNHNMALFRKANGVYLYDFKKYDFISQTETLFGNNIGSIAWAPDDSKIAYFYTPPTGERTLVFSNITNTEHERVYNFAIEGLENPLLHWSSDSQWLLVIPRSQKFETNNIYLFNAYSRSIKKLTDTGNQVDASFSPDGTKIIYATYSKDPNESIPFVLSIMDINGENKKSLGARADVRKAVWFNDSKNILLVSYDSQTKKDYIFKFNIEKGEKSFSINNSGQDSIGSVMLVNNDEILLYESGKDIFAIKSSILK